MSSDLEGYGQESEPQEGPEAKHRLTKDCSKHWLHASSWRGSACTARAAVAHSWRHRSSDHMASIPHTYMLQLKESKSIPAAQMTNATEQPTANGKE